MKVCPQCATEYADDQLFCSRDGVTLRTVASAHDLVGTIIADRYVVRSKLGEGGMGQVYLAEHVRMGRKSAVKVMRPNMLSDADSIARFVREATNASQIDHPNVAAIYDFGETADGLTYLAMEYVDGEPLSKILEREGALGPARAAEIVQQTAAALGAAHEMHIVHRDLKPDNIMVAKHRDGRDRVKVVDFGIAKVVNAQEQHVTMSGVLIGTPMYMSPEQVGGDPLDGRSDEYALALVAVKMLTGELPFAGETTYEVMTSRLAGKPRTLHEIRADVSWPPELEAVLDKALAMAPSQRYATAVEFAEAFARAATLMDASTVVAAIGGTGARGSGRSAERPSGIPVTRERGEARPRGRRWLAAAGLVAVLGAGAGGAVLWRGAHAVAAKTDSVQLAGVPAAQTEVAQKPAQPDSGPRLVPGGEGHAPVTQLNQPLSSAAVPAPPRRDTAPPPTYSAFSGKSRSVLDDAPPAKPQPPATDSMRDGSPDSAASQRVEIRRMYALARQTQRPAQLRRAVDLSYQEMPRMTTRPDSVAVLVIRARALATLGQRPAACTALTSAEAMAAGRPKLLALVRNAGPAIGCAPAP